MSGGAALGPIGAIKHDIDASKKAKKAQGKTIKGAQGAFMDALDRSRQLGSSGVAYQKNAIKTLHGANKQAMGIAAKMGTSAYNRVLDREQQAKGDLQQRAVSSGLYSTSALDSANRGVMSDTNRALADITDSLGGLQISTLQQGAGQEANAMQELSRYLQSQGISEAAIYEALAQFLGGIQHTPGTSALGTLGGFAKLGLSAFGGGAGGAAGGGNAIAGGGGIF